MTPTWAQRREALLSDCLVSPDIFHQMLDRLGAFVVPYQRALASEAAQHPMHLYLQGLLSRKRSQGYDGGTDLAKVWSKTDCASIAVGASVFAAHLITSSSWKRRVAGIVILRVSAVFRLII